MVKCHDHGAGKRGSMGGKARQFGEHPAKEQNAGMKSPEEQRLRTGASIRVRTDALLITNRNRESFILRWLR